MSRFAPPNGDRRKPHAELTDSPEVDQDAAVQRELARREAERAAAMGLRPHPVPRRA